jgi:hypothetical protein
MMWSSDVRTQTVPNSHSRRPDGGRYLFAGRFFAAFFAAFNFLARAARAFSRFLARFARASGDSGRRFLATLFTGALAATARGPTAGRTSVISRRRDGVSLRQPRQRRILRLDNLLSGDAKGYSVSTYDEILEIQESKDSSSTTLFL